MCWIWTSQIISGLSMGKLGVSPTTNDLIILHILWSVAHKIICLYVCNKYLETFHLEYSWCCNTTWSSYQHGYQCCTSLWMVKSRRHKKSFQDQQLRTSEGEWMYCFSSKFFLPCVSWSLITCIFLFPVRWLVEWRWMVRCTKTCRKQYLSDQTVHRNPKRVWIRMYTWLII